MLIVLISVVVYHGALSPSAEFTYDDDAIVKDSRRLNVRNWDDVHKLVWGKYWGDAYRSERLWRPVPLLTFAADRTLFGRGPAGFHRTNVGLHALASLFVLFLLRRLLVARRLALAGALLFAAHPIHAEAVTGIVGRTEVLALLGAVGGSVLHLRARQSTSVFRQLFLMAGAALCFLLGFCSKEIALTAPFILVLFEQVAPRPRSNFGRVRRAVSFSAPYLLYFLVVAGYFGLRWYALTRGLNVGDEAALFPTQKAQTLGALPFSDRFLVATLTLRDSLGALIAPTTTSAVYGLPYDWEAGPSWSKPGVWLAVALHGTLLVAGSWCLRRRRPQVVRALGLGVWGFYLAMGPVSNLIPIGVIRADRLLYTPSLYVCLSLAAALGLLDRAATRSGVRAPVLLPLLGVLLFGFTLRLGENVTAWSSDVALWETSLTHFKHAASVESGRCNLALGKYKLNDPRLELDAQRHFEAAIVGFAPPERWSKYAAEARWGLAMTVMNQDPPRAHRILAEAHEIDPASRSVAFGGARLHLLDAERTKDPALQRRSLRLAEQSARAGVRFASTDYDLWLLLGTILTRLDGRGAEAEAAFNRAVERNDYPWQALLNRGRLRFGAKDLVGALDDYRAVTSLLEPALLGQTLSDEMRSYLPDALLHQTVLALESGGDEEAGRCLGLLQAYFPTHPGLAKLEEELRRRQGQ